MDKRIQNLLKEARRENRKLFSVLVDPDKTDSASLDRLIADSRESGVDLFLVGSSILRDESFTSTLLRLREKAPCPVVLFPGNALQVSDQADGILLLSLISGRNADLLIGQHVIAAPFLQRSGIEILPTGYLLIDSGAPTSVSYMSQTLPIPHDKDDIAACTALAGEQLGLQLIYLDAGSGARHPVSARMVRAVRQAVDVPIIVGGGIRTPEKAAELALAGADMIVIGNSLETDPGLLQELADAVHLTVG
jgi:putative glycerol-1-phosphate prenyltransferase